MDIGGILSSYGFTNPSNTIDLMRMVETIPFELQELLKGSLLKIHRTTITDQDIEFLMHVVGSGDPERIKWCGDLILKLREIRYMLQECQKDPNVMNYYKNYFYTNYFSLPLQRIFEEVKEVKQEIQTQCTPQSDDTLLDLKKKILEVSGSCVGFEDEFLAYFEGLLDEIVGSKMYFDPKREKLVAILNGIRDLCGRAGGFAIATELKRDLLEFLSTTGDSGSIRGYFSKLTDLIISEMLPHRETGLEDIFRRLEDLERNPHLDRFIREIGDQDIGGTKRKVVTMKSLVPQRLPERDKSFPPREMGDSLLLRDREMPELVGRYRPMNAKDDRLLINVDPKGPPTFTGFYHPYVVDQSKRQMFECGMRCRRDRDVEENKSILDACHIQLERRKKNTKGTPGDIKTIEFTQRNIDDCRNIISKQQNPKPKHRSRTKRHKYEKKPDTKRRRTFGSLKKKKGGVVNRRSLKR